MYIRLGIGWEIFEEQGYMWLGNSLTSKLYSIKDNTNREIIRQISNGTTEKEIMDQYDQKEWEKFKAELINNKVIFYSNHKSSFADRLDRGGKLLETSSFIKSKIYISRIAIEVNNECDKNCRFCNEDNEIPCLSCYKNRGNKMSSIDISIVEKFWNDLAEITVPEVLLTGAKPMDDINLIRNIVNILNKRVQKPKIYIVCNDSVSTEVIQFLHENNILMIINIIECNNDYLNRMEAFIKNLEELSVQYVIYKRVETDRFMCAQKSRLIPDIIAQKENIVAAENIIRNYSIDVNSLVGLRNMCTYGKVLLKIDGSLSVCREFGQVANNVSHNAAVKLIASFEEIWNRAYPTKKCEKCNLNKLCVNCPGIIEKYSDYSKFCFV